MRYVDVHPPESDIVLRPKPERLSALVAYLVQEIEDAHSARFTQEQCWTECLRQYEGVPKNPIRNIPIENAPNTEVTLGAIAADAIYAQAIDLIFNQVSPLAMVNATTGKDEDLVQTAKALQTLVNVMARTEWDIRGYAEQMALDWNQLGTGVGYIPWIARTKKTRVYDVLEVGAKPMSPAVEDFLVPGGSYEDLQTMPWVALRFWLTDGELAERSIQSEWDISQAKAVGVKGWMRTKREQLGRTTSSAKYMILYEIYDVYVYFDIDGDGVEEDLLITWDRTSTNILKIRYNPYDRRPFDAARYQKRKSLFYALGVLEMIRSYQDELTEIHNDTLTNSRLANTRMWRGRPSAVQGGNVRVWPNRFIEASEPDAFGEIKLSDVYPSAYRNEASVIAYAEHRVGVRELSGPSPSKVLGGRTPGITALSVLQQTNQRFAPAFDDLRRAVASTIRQCLWRYRERLLAGDVRAESNITDVLGLEDGTRVIELLKSPRFEESINVELTATSASINRAQDRQDALLLVNFLGQYYEKAINLMQIASQPGTTEAVKKVATQIAEKIGEIIDRTIRTFESVRDPQMFILDMEEAVDALQTDQGGLQGLMQQLQGTPAGNSFTGLAIPGPAGVQ